MTLILCADDRDGLLFNRRRLSKDSAVCSKILSLCAGNTLWMSAYSASIFPHNAPNIRLWEKFPDDIQEGDYCFVENADITVLFQRVKRVVIYRWNRSYPSDVKIPQSLLSGLQMVEATDFSGSSHPCITQEVYEK